MARPAARLPAPLPVPAAQFLPSIEALNTLSTAEFARALGVLFEGAPRFLGRLAAARPFAGYAELWPAALRIARAMPEPEQLELIDAHPRLGAPPATVSELSFREQGYDQVGGSGGSLAVDLARLNSDYEARFGFRFCVFVNGRARASLVPVIAAALEADRTSEIRRALGEVVAIAADRARGMAG